MIRATPSDWINWLRFLRKFKNPPVGIHELINARRVITNFFRVAQLSYLDNWTNETSLHLLYRIILYSLKITGINFRYTWKTLRWDKQDTHEPGGGGRGCLYELYSMVAYDCHSYVGCFERFFMKYLK